MFRSAQTFNQPVSHFDVRRVTDLCTLMLLVDSRSTCVLRLTHVHCSIRVLRVLCLQPEFGRLEYKQCDVNE
jgi:hypothetical protein